MITQKHKLLLSFYFGQIFFKIMTRNKKVVSTFLTIIQEEGGDEGYGAIPLSMIMQVLFIWHH